MSALSATASVSADKIAMNKLLWKIGPILIFITAVALAAFLSAGAPPKKEPLYHAVEGELAFDDAINVLIQGDSVGSPGAYRLPRRSTYGELFALANVRENDAYDPQDYIRFEDAVLLGGEYYVYIVL